MKVGDLVQCGDETGVILDITPYDSDEEFAEACDWVEVLWSGIPGTTLETSIEGVSRSDIDFWTKEGVWVKPESKKAL